MVLNCGKKVVKVLRVSILGVPILRTSNVAKKRGLYFSNIDMKLLCFGRRRTYLRIEKSS